MDKSTTRHVCSGCGAVLQCKRDIEKVPGSMYPKWRCRSCQTSVPGIVAEKLKHQKHHEVPSDT